MPDFRQQLTDTDARRATSPGTSAGSWWRGVSIAFLIPALVWIFGSMTGCARNEGVIARPNVASSFVASPSEIQEIRRVILLPMEHEPAHFQAASRVRNELATELRQFGQFEVVCPEEDYFISWHDDSLIRGFPSAHLLEELAKHFAADAVIFSSLRDYHAYGNPRIGIVANLVCTYNGRTLAAIDGTWDSRNPSTAHHAITFACRDQTPLRGESPDSILKTPSWYERFVAHEIANKMLHPPALPHDSGRTPSFIEAPVTTAEVESPELAPIEPR